VSYLFQGGFSDPLGQGGPASTAITLRWVKSMLGSYLVETGLAEGVGRYLDVVFPSQRMHYVDSVN
jgi:hypothetical protein